MLFFPSASSKLSAFCLGIFFWNAPSVAAEDANPSAAWEQALVDAWATIGDCQLETGMCDACGFGTSWTIDSRGIAITQPTAPAANTFLTRYSCWLIHIFEKARLSSISTDPMVPMSEHTPLAPAIRRLHGTKIRPGKLLPLPNPLRPSPR